MPHMCLTYKIPESWTKIKTNKIEKNEFLLLIYIPITIKKILKKYEES